MTSFLGTAGLIAAVIAWFGAIAFGWLVATILAADKWGGGWLFGSGPISEHYDAIQASIAIAALLVAFGGPALVTFLVRRK